MSVTGNAVAAATIAAQDAVVSAFLVAHPPGSAVSASDLVQYRLDLEKARGGAISVSFSTISQVEIDFGTSPVTEASFSVSTSLATANSKAMAQLAYVAPTGKVLDELTMDHFDFMCSCSAGSVAVYARSLDGPVHGKFKINITISEA